MNPLIKKFWENKAPVGYYKSDINKMELWFLCSDSDYYNRDGPPPPKLKDVIYMRRSQVTAYYFENKIYSEEDMLKIIKMKAFI